MRCKKRDGLPAQWGLTVPDLTLLLVRLASAEAQDGD